MAPRKQGRRPRRKTGQYLHHSFTLNIVEDGAHAITAGQLGIPDNRPARAIFAAVQFGMKENAQASTFTVISMAIKDGNGETDARSRQMLIGPTIQKARVRTARGLDFDHYNASDVVLYFDVNNHATTNVVTINGVVRVQYLNENIRSPVQFVPTQLLTAVTNAECTSLNSSFEKLKV